MSKRASNKSKKNKKPVIVSQTVASTQSGEESLLLSGRQTKQIQELIDLLKKNSLTEMEIEREGLRVRVCMKRG